MQPDALSDLLDNPAFRRWVYAPTPADEQYWAIWLGRHPDAAPTVELARYYLLQVRGEVPALPDTELNGRIGQLLAQANEADVPVIPFGLKTRWRWYAAAASVALLLLGYVGIRTYTNSRAATSAAVVSYQRIRVTNTSQQMRFVSLADGSTVLLQPNSQLDYEQPFRPDSRRVWLTGEAFFEVTKNPKQPFRVQADRHFATQVLGTSFRIRAFANEASGLVVVKTGRVAVFSKPGNVPNAVLTARQQAVVVRNVPTVTPTVSEPTLPIERLSFRFTAVPLRQVMRELGAAYGVQITLSPALANCTLTATLGDEPLPQKLQMLCAAVEATYLIEGQQIRLDGVGCSPSVSQ